MNRRNFLMTGTAGIILSQVAIAAEPKSAGKTLDAKKLETLGTASGNCLEAASACLAHCDRMIAAGDNSMKSCRESVVNLIAVVGSMKKVTAENSVPAKLIKDLAKVCGEYCKHCEGLCEPHAKTHDVCKKCLDSCKECRAACEALA